MNFLCGALCYVLMSGNGPSVPAAGRSMGLRLLEAAASGPASCRGRLRMVLDSYRGPLSLHTFQHDACTQLACREACRVEPQATAAAFVAATDKHCKGLRQKFWRDADAIVLHLYFP